MRKSIIIFLLFLFSQLLAGFSTLMMKNWDNIAAGRSIDWLRAADPTVPQVLVVGLWISYVLLFVCLWLLRLTNSPMMGNLKRGSRLRSLGFIGSFLLICVGLSLLITPLGLDDGGMTDQALQIKEYWGGVLLLCIGGPAIEEVVFRDGILRHLRTRGLNAWAAILISAATFAVVHGNLSQFVTAFPLGILLGFLYVRTGDLRLCLPAHILNNTIAVMGLLFPKIDDFIEQMPLLLMLAAGGLLTALAHENSQPGFRGTPHPFGPYGRCHRHWLPLALSAIGGFYGLLRICGRRRVGAYGEQKFGETDCV